MNIRVLVVDDSSTMRFQLRRLFTAEQDIEVVEAKDGHEALGMLVADHGVHVIVSDLMMKGLDGHGLVLAIRRTERLAALPIIMLTASTDDEHPVENLVAGANDYIVKDEKAWPALVAKVRNLAAIRQRQEAAEKASWTDALTGLTNRRYAEMRLTEELDRRARHGGELCVALLDIDHFKKVNDTFGHQAGDDVLASVARELRSVSRASDVVARWGGEEFLFLFPDTPAEAAGGILERFRKHLASVPVVVRSQNGTHVPVTISGGVAAAEDGDSPTRIVERADQALYAAKDTGRNRLLLWQLGQMRPVAAA